MAHDFIPIEIGELAGDVVHFVFVIAILRASEHIAAHRFVALPVCREGRNEIGEAVFLLLEDQCLHGHQRIGTVGETDAGQDRAQAIFRAAAGEVLPFFHAAVHQEREVGARHDVGVYFLAREGADDADADQMLHLLVEKIFKFFVALAIGELSGKAHELAGDGAHAIVHGVLHGGCQVDIASRGPFADFAEMRHYAAAVAPVASVLRRQAGSHQHLGAGGVIVDCRETGAAADELAHRQQKFRRAIRMDAHAKARLVGLHCFRGLQAQIGNLIRRVAAVPLAAADGEVLEGIVACKELGGVAGNRPYPFGELQPQRFDEL